MPRTLVIFYKEDDDSVPVLEYFQHIPEQARYKLISRIQLLREKGHELRRPCCDYLRNDIYELRASYRNIQYRLLYFFYGREAVVVSHGLVKEKRVPDREIDLAVRRLAKFMKHPDRHSYIRLEKWHEQST